MNVNVKLFARARDLAGTSQAMITLSHGESVHEMLESLVDAYPALAQIQNNLLVAVNNEYVSAETIVPADAEIACFPPVSGG